MNLLSQFTAIFGQQERGFATAVGVHRDGRLIATTPSGATVLLTGEAELGKNVFYDRVSGRVLNVAPSVAFKSYGV